MKKINNVKTGFWKTDARFSLLVITGSIALVLAYLVSPRGGPSGLAAPFAGTISGTVFEDLNGNGTKDTNETTGLVGVVVTATDNLGNTQSGTTDSSGNYTLASLAGTSARVEFGAPPVQAANPTGQYVTTIAGGTTVQFLTLTSNQTGVNAGFIDTTKWCANNPRISVPCWAVGKFDHPDLANEPVLVSVPYNTTVTSNDQTYLANSPQLGSTWGQAFQESTGIIFVSAVIRRHTDTGPQGLAGLYAIRPGASGGTQLWSIDLNTLSNTFGTALTRNGLAGRGAPSQDTQAFDKVGKTGIGDIDLSEDGNTLWIVNLEDRALVRADVTGGAQPTSLTSFNLANAAGIPSCTNGVLRPWGLKLANSKGYLGVVCTAESGGVNADLGAYVLSFDPTTGPTAFTQELNIPLGFQRGWGYLNVNPANVPPANRQRFWNAWKSSLDVPNMCGAQYTASGGGVSIPTRECVFPTPILSDIEFDDNGNMIIGFIDRTSMQLGGMNHGPTDTNFYQSFSSGDMLLACFNGGSYQLESNGACVSASGPLTGSGVGNSQGPGNGEFHAGDYWRNSAGPHQETFQGGLAVLRGRNPREVVSIIMDPVNFYAGGLGWFNNTNGARIKVYEIYNQSVNNWPPAPGSMNKATGLGDIEIFCVPPPLEIGNRIWNDINGDGIQDPNEPGIAGVQVSLFQGGVQVGSSVTTNSSGRYLFNTSLLPNTAYEIRVSETQLQTLGYPTLSSADAGQGVVTDSDLRDSDAVLNGGNGVISVTTGNYGSVNHTLDMGWLTVPIYSLGNRVWKDQNNNGTIDSADGSNPGVNGVVVRLLDATTLTQATNATGALVPNQTTSNGGYYRFDNLLAGNYIVEVMSTNFLTGSGVLAGYESSLTDETDPNSDVDSNDNGLGTTPSGTTGVRSGVVVLGNGNGSVEPTNDNDPSLNPGTGESSNNRSNRTVDFGFALPPYSLGNRVWTDLNNSGTIDAADGPNPGVDGVIVRLLDGGTLTQATDLTGALVPDQTTSGGGYYRFDNLLAGNYVVEVRGSNFTGTGILVGFNSSSTDESNPNNDVDSNDNGVGSIPSTTTGVRSGVATLGNGTGFAEPTNDNDPSLNPGTGESRNDRSNRTVDFGFAQSFAIGNRIWLDADADGIQDSGEVGIDGVTVDLYLNGVLVGQTTTSSGGTYLFTNMNVNLNGATGLLPNSSYVISVSTNTFPLKGLTLSPANAAPTPSGDLQDSDGVPSGNKASIALRTGATPESNSSYDFGFAVMTVELSDPAVCLSAGGIVEIVVVLGNPSATTSPDGTGPELQVDLPSTISRVISANTQTGSSGTGTVTINGVSQILWNGALNAGDKVTLTYLVQLASVTQGVQICPRSTAAYDSNFDGTKDSTAVVDICMEVTCPVVGAGAPVPASTETSGQVAGSVLIYNIYTSTVNTARQDTRLTLTNTHPLTSVFVHLFFVDGQSCSVADRFVSLTANQTISFLASDLDPEVTGYLIAVATDQSGCPIQFNYLIGSEYVKFESGHAAGLQALTIAAPGNIACNPGQPTTTLAFDGLSYNKLPRTLAFDSLFPAAGGNQTMVVINRLGGNLSSAGGSTGQFFGLLFDDIERSSSFTLTSSSCQMRGLLSPNFPRTVPRFDQVIPAGRSGWMKLWAGADEGLSGTMINFNASNLFNQGHNLHILSLTGSVTYTMPVYPPQ